MGRYTDAYGSFTIRLREVELLTRKAAEWERREPIAKADEIKAVCRGAIVLLSSHLEGYVRDLGEVTLDRIFHRGVDRSGIVPRFFYSISRDHFELISDSSDPDAIAKRVFDFLGADLALWKQDGPFLAPLPMDRFMKGFASPSVAKIGKFLHRFGYETYKRDLGRLLRADYIPTTTMIENVVAARNNIAHGDPNETRTPKDVSEMMRQCQLFCRTTDDVFSSWAKTALCTLR